MEAEIPEYERDSAQFTVDCVEMPLPMRLFQFSDKRFKIYPCHKNVKRQV
jgi:hypothetical protein